MPSSHPTKFRFRDLPAEIRNKIYRELLCDFKPQPTTIDPASMLELAPAHHDIDTAILRTSKAVYREAYDVMIKTNRFVKITSVRGLPLWLLLNGLRVPIVTSDKGRVDKFKGYVLAVHLGCENPLPIPEGSDGSRFLVPCTLMVLHRDVDVFCLALTDGDAHAPGFSENLQISMTVAPDLNEQKTSHNTPSLRDFFSESMQKRLLAPFRTRLRGYKAVKIQGYVDQALANTVREEMKLDRWSDPEQVLADFAAAKEEGSRLFQLRKVDEGTLIWQDAAVDLDKMLESSSWPTLVKRGGECFISQLAELYFLVRLNVAHVTIARMQNPTSLYFEFEGIMAKDALNSATRSLKRDHWMRGYKYRPSDQHLAKLRYRFALLLRLQDEPGTVDRALSYIDGALRLQPGDAAILKERNHILAWQRRGY